MHLLLISVIDTMVQLKCTDIDVPADSVSKQSDKVRVAGPYEDPQSSMVRDNDPSSAVFLRTNWQIQGYLQEQADTIEK
jgi:anaphase-promoting complex subunit 5